MRVYPVVHINEDPSVAPVQVSKAFEYGADGVYLIDHFGIDPGTIFRTFNKVSHEHPDEFIGVNMLGFRPSGALLRIQEALDSGELNKAPDALWADDIRADSHLGDAMTLKEYLEGVRKVRILGGVAFKYTATYSSGASASSKEAVELEPYVDTVTTSGEGTGHAPSVAKIRAMKNVIKGPLAVASGISSSNLYRYKGLVDEVLVASSIETRPYSGVFDDKKLKAFIDKAHSLDAQNSD